VYDSHEFAIDPSHPRFLGTEGMKKVLEEGRRKRASGADSGEGGEEGSGKRKKAEGGSGKRGAGDELKSLVESVKKKARVRV